MSTRADGLRLATVALVAVNTVATWLAHADSVTSTGTRGAVRFRSSTPAEVFPILAARRW